MESLSVYSSPLCAAGDSLDSEADGRCLDGLGLLPVPAGVGPDLLLVLPPIWLPMTLRKPVLFHLTFFVGKQVPLAVTFVFLLKIAP